MCHVTHHAMLSRATEVSTRWVLVSSIRDAPSWAIVIPGLRLTGHSQYADFGVPLSESAHHPALCHARLWMERRKSNRLYFGDSIHFRLMRIALSYIATEFLTYRCNLEG